jgi:hypothetical protein
MFLILEDKLSGRFLPSSQVKGAPSQHCEAAARCSHVSAGPDKRRKRQAVTVAVASQSGTAVRVTCAVSV